MDSWAPLSQAAPGQPHCSNGLVGSSDLKHKAQRSHLSHSVVFVGKPMPSHTRPKCRINPTKPPTRNCIRTKILCMSPWLFLAEGRAESLVTDVHRTTRNSKYPEAKTPIAVKLAHARARAHTHTDTIIPLAKPAPSSQGTSGGQEDTMTRSQETRVLIPDQSPISCGALNKSLYLHQVSALLPQGYQPSLLCRAIGRTSENIDVEIITNS